MLEFHFKTIITRLRVDGTIIRNLLKQIIAQVLADWIISLNVNLKEK